MPRLTAVFLIEGDILSESYEDQPHGNTNPRRREPTHKGHAQKTLEMIARNSGGRPKPTAAQQRLLFGEFSSLRRR